MSRLVAFLSIVFWVPLGVGVCNGQSTTPDPFDRGVSQLRERKFEQALESFKASLLAAPNSPETLFNLGFTYLQLRRPSEAVRVLRQATGLRPTEGKFQIALCDALAADGKASEGLKYCEEGIRLGERTDEAQLVTLSVMKAANMPLRGIEDRLEAALVLSPENVRMMEFAADHYYWTQQFDRSAEYWDRLTKIDPKSGYYFARLALALFSLERETEAISLAKKALELDPANPFGHYFMGRLFLELGQNGDASAAFDKARIAKEKLPSAQYYYAVSESRRGRKDSAIQAFGEAVRLNPEDYQSNYELGILLSNSGRFEEAIPPLRKALALRPREFEAKVGLGLVLFESTQFTEAITLLEEANSARPGNEVVNMFLRVARSRQQSIPRIEEMKRAARENLLDVPIRVELITLLAYARRLNETEPILKEFFELKPTNVKDYQRVAVGYVTAGSPEKALETYQRAQKLGEDAGTYFGMATIFASRGQADLASAAYVKTLTLKPDSPGILKLYADHLRDNGKRREALAVYKQAIGITPNDGPSLSNAAVLSARLGDVDNANAYVATLRLTDPRHARRIERLIPSLRFPF